MHVGPTGLLEVSPNLEKRHGMIADLTGMWETARDVMRRPSNVAYPPDDVGTFTNTVVHKVSFTNSVVDGVELNDGRKIAVRKQVIICANAYGTTQVLMRSGLNT